MYAHRTKIITKTFKNSHEVFQINNICVLAGLTIHIITHAIVVPLLVLVTGQVRNQRLLNIPRRMIHILRMVILRHHIFRHITDVWIVPITLQGTINRISIVNTDTAHIVRLLGPLVRHWALNIPSCLLKSSYDWTLLL